MTTSTLTTSPTLKAALHYSQDRGWRVLPTKGKAPIVKGGYKAATTDEAKIVEWFSSTPTANVGIRTGDGLLVVDVDGPEGLESLLKLESQYSKLPLTLTAGTGRGFHLYLAYPSHLRVPSIKLGDHLDTRADGGLVVVPPSIHPNGKRYVWLRHDEPAQAPAWLLERLGAVEPEPEWITVTPTRWLALVMLDWSLGHAWKGRTGTTDSIAYNAVVRTAFFANRLTVFMSERMEAEQTGLSPRTAANALKRLSKQGRLKAHAPAHDPLWQPPVRHPPCRNQ